MIIETTVALTLGLLVAEFLEQPLRLVPQFVPAPVPVTVDP